MTRPLVVVESPTKVRTLKKYLGSDYNVAATVGHFKDLPSNEMGIDIENGFTPQYKTIPGKQKVIQSLRRAAGEAVDVYLAPDPDREGEAIAWHTSEVLNMKGRRFHRVLFHELTQNAILKAMASPEKLDRSKYEAQQTRRVLDRLVGYEVSPILWRKVQGGLSAGRVQSVAVRIICERERAIQAFESEEFWTITALLEAPDPPPFQAKLVKKDGAKITIPNEEAARKALAELDGRPFIVEKVVKKEIRKNPLPAFTTSKLQQESIRKLHFSAKKTMLLAQQLYEGIDLGPGEPVGLITYMRTDSTRVSQEAVQEVRKLIVERFGEAYRPAAPRQFRNKKKVQDAHEAVRPTSVFRTPDQVASFLTPDQLALYRLIWERFVASQMQSALVDQTTVSIAANGYLFQATGSVVRFPGFMALYQSEEEEGRKEEEAKMPPLKEGTGLDCKRLEPKQHFTQPPPRFSEASLVKELEEKGIGRPSTYATILSTIRDKGYVDLVKGYFRPSELGFIVNDLLVGSFSDVFDPAFTARMEDALDKIETAQDKPIDVLTNFYGAFKKDLAVANEKMVNIKGVGVSVGLDCPACGRQLHIKMGKNGAFLACSGYPECRFTRNYTRDEKGNIVMEAPARQEATDQVCDKCGQPMVLKQGRYGSFLACSAYPACKNTRSLENGRPSSSTGVSCPEGGCSGELVEKKSKRGKIFYGCNRYPACTYAIWDRPVPRPCPRCSSPFLVEKTSKKGGTHLACPTSGCFYKETSSD